MGFYLGFNRFLIIVLLCCVSYPICALERKNDSLLNTDIQTILNKNRDRYNLPAISISIRLPESNQTEDYVSGYYSLKKDRNITPETLFQIGSITKTFIATIVFKLIEENKLSSNDKLEKYLPQYPRWKNITIYDLLHHTSGIYNYISGKNFDNALRKNPQKYWSLNELANIAYNHQDISAPGEKYNYTNTDYILLGMIIEKTTHKPLEKIFSDYFKQYNLHDTFYSPAKYPDEIKNKIANGYNRDGTFKFNTDVTMVSLSIAQSAGAMISTPHDLINWLHDLFTGKIITNKSLAEMTKIISEKNTRPINSKEFYTRKKLIKSALFTEIGAGAGIGLLYFKNNGFNWVHAGGTPGYESFYAYNPCKGIYLALTYNVKPKEQLIFLRITDEIFNRLNNSPEVIKAIELYQHNNLLPDYCAKS